MRRARTIRHRRPTWRRDESDCSSPKGFFIVLNPQVLVPVSAPRGETGDVFLDRTRPRSPFDSIPLAVGDLAPWGGSANPSCPNRTLVSKLRAPRVAKARTTRLGCLPMAKRMSLQCPLCDELVAAFGRERTVAAIAQHVRIKHVELTEARRNDLAQRPWQPLPLADSLIVARPIRIEPRT